MNPHPCGGLACLQNRIVWYPQYRVNCWFYSIIKAKKRIYLTWGNSKSEQHVVEIQPFLIKTRDPANLRPLLVF